MFCVESKGMIKNAIAAETASAIVNWGDKYNSLHEGYAVLLEEVEEAEIEMDLVKENLSCMWETVKRGHEPGDKINAVENIASRAERLALEAVQVAAVCNKIKNSL